MRILHVSSSYPVTPGDSTAPFMEEMLGALAERGHEIRVIVPRIADLAEGDRRGVRVDGFAYAPGPLQTWGYGRSLAGDGRLRLGTFLVAPFALIAKLVAVRRAVTTWKPDVVHLHWLIPQGAVGLVLPRHLPIVISVHGADARFALGKLRVVARRAARRADAVIAASRPILDAVASLDSVISDKSIVIPHGADGRLFGTSSRSTARSTLGLPQDEPIVFAVGRLVQKKGFDSLIEAATDADLAGVRFALAGSGPEEQGLRHLATERDASVEFLGQLGREQVAQWLAAADVVAIPSRPVGHDVDSGPVVLMEAMASGTGVVTTSIGMASDVIHHGTNGLFVEPDRPADLAAALRSAIAHSEEFGIAARAQFERIGSWDRVAEDLEDLYQALIGGTPPPS